MEVKPLIPNNPLILHRLNTLCKLLANPVLRPFLVDQVDHELGLVVLAGLIDVLAGKFYRSLEVWVDH